MTKLEPERVAAKSGRVWLSLPSHPVPTLSPAFWEPPHNPRTPLTRTLSAPYSVSEAGGAAGSGGLVPKALRDVAAQPETPCLARRPAPGWEGNRAGPGGGIWGSGASWLPPATSPTGLSAGCAPNFPGAGGVRTMNVFRILGDLSHLLAMILLLGKIWRSKSCAGERQPRFACFAPPSRPGAGVETKTGDRVGLKLCTSKLLEKTRLRCQGKKGGGLRD